MMVFDKKDLVILSELLKNGRMSYTEIAEKLNMSVPAVTKRIDKLQASKVIERYTIEINYELLTRGTPTIFLIKCPKKLITEVSSTLYNLPYVKEIYQTNGTFDILVISHFIHDKERKEFIETLNDFDAITDYEMLYVSNILPDKKELFLQDVDNIELICDYCKRTFSKDIFTKVIAGKKRYFCCNTCLQEYEKKMKMQAD